MRKKLEQGIELEKLNAGAFKNLCARHAREELLHHAFGPAIAIADGQFDQLAIRVYQAIIDAPAINSKALNFSSEFARARGGFTQTFFYLVKDSGECPNADDRPTLRVDIETAVSPEAATLRYQVRPERPVRCRRPGRLRCREVVSLVRVRVQLSKFGFKSCLHVMNHGQ